MVGGGEAEIAMRGAGDRALKGRAPALASTNNNIRRTTRGTTSCDEAVIAHRGRAQFSRCREYAGTRYTCSIFEDAARTSRARPACTEHQRVCWPLLRRLERAGRARPLSHECAVSPQGGSGVAHVAPHRAAAKDAARLAWAGATVRWRCVGCQREQREVLCGVASASDPRVLL
jgi:hypothetical protein